MVDIIFRNVGDDENGKKERNKKEEEEKKKGRKVSRTDEIRLLFSSRQ